MKTTDLSINVPPTRMVKYLMYDVIDTEQVIRFSNNCSGEKAAGLPARGPRQQAHNSRRACRGKGTRGRTGVQMSAASQFRVNNNIAAT